MPPASSPGTRLVAGMTTGPVASGADCEPDVLAGTELFAATPSSCEFPRMGRGQPPTPIGTTLANGPCAVRQEERSATVGRMPLRRAFEWLSSAIPWLLLRGGSQNCGDHRFTTNNKKRSGTWQWRSAHQPGATGGIPRGLCTVRYFRDTRYSQHLRQITHHAITHCLPSTIMGRSLSTSIRPRGSLAATQKAVPPPGHRGLPTPVNQSSEPHTGPAQSGLTRRQDRAPAGAYTGAGASTGTQPAIFLGCPAARHRQSPAMYGQSCTDNSGPYCIMHACIVQWCRPDEGTWVRPGPPHVCAHHSGSAPAKMVDTHADVSVCRHYFFAAIPVRRDEKLPCAARRHGPRNVFCAPAPLAGSPPLDITPDSWAEKHRSHHHVEVRENATRRACSLTAEASRPRSAHDTTPERGAKPHPGVV